MKTMHRFIHGTATDMSLIADKSVELVVTSPPYPMIEMWDDCFISQDETIDIANPCDAFKKMHAILKSAWDECDRVLIDGGIICINIGDATRNLNDIFQVYPNHSEIINYFSELKYSMLPPIIWRKQSNAPNKFMGSGMYPPGAYVTHEHEYILIFRKGGKRLFKSEIEKDNRRESAYFWEERNCWFSDLWDFKGTTQSLNINGIRDRSGAFPFELAYRLINMYSVKGDNVLDPFAGTGTTSLASLLSERNSLNIEYVSELVDHAIVRCFSSKNQLNRYASSRYHTHLEFIRSLDDEKFNKCYDNKFHTFKVKTKQERDIKLSYVSNISTNEIDTVFAEYKDMLFEKRENLGEYVSIEQYNIIHQTQ